jgi:hypothetical protein
MVADGVTAGVELQAGKLAVWPLTAGSHQAGISGWLKNLAYTDFWPGT